MVKPKYKSDCCNADVRVVGSGDFSKDDICTMHYQCVCCLNPCDIKSFDDDD